MADPPRVALRTPAPEDEELLYLLQSDLDTWEERLPSSPTTMTREAFRARAAQRDPDRNVEFVVVLDGVPVGRTTIFNESALSRNAEVGIALIAEARGRGVGTEALRQTVEFAFTRRNLRRVFLWVLSSNLAGINTYRKLGFVEEGRHREHAWVRGKYEDEVTMGLLRSEWR